MPTFLSKKRRTVMQARSWRHNVVSPGSHESKRRLLKATELPFAAPIAALTTMWAAGVSQVACVAGGSISRSFCSSSTNTTRSCRRTYSIITEHIYIYIYYRTYMIYIFCGSLPNTALFNRPPPKMTSPCQGSDLSS